MYNLLLIHDNTPIFYIKKSLEISAFLIFQKKNYI